MEIVVLIAAGLVYVLEGLPGEGLGGGVVGRGLRTNDRGHDDFSQLLSKKVVRPVYLRQAPPVKAENRPPSQ